MEKRETERIIEEIMSKHELVSSYAFILQRAHINLLFIILMAFKVKTKQ